MLLFIILFSPNHFPFTLPTSSSPILNPCNIDADCGAIIYRLFWVRIGLKYSFAPREILFFTVPLHEKFDAKANFRKFAYFTYVGSHLKKHFMYPNTCETTGITYSYTILIAKDHLDDEIIREYSTGKTSMGITPIAGQNIYPLCTISRYSLIRFSQ